MIGRGGRTRRRLRVLDGTGYGRREPVTVLAQRYPRAVVCGAALVAAGAFAVLAGPVAAGCAGAYAGAAALLLVRRRRAVRAAAAWSSALDAVEALAGDLRAGQPGPAALAVALPALANDDPAVRLVADQVAAAVSVGDVTGAPLADLLERVEADARAGHRRRERSRAQAAGATATAWLLAALPVAGVALGYGLGADPLQMLLHTRLGAGCASAAVLLQFAGVYWTSRLVHRSDEVAW